MKLREYLPDSLHEFGKTSAAVAGTVMAFGIGSFLLDESGFVHVDKKYKPTSELLAEYDDGFPGIPYNGMPVSHAEDALSDARSMVIKSDEALQAAEDSASEACKQVLEVYLYGGGLMEAEDDLVVSDILAEPEQPCGDTPREVREHFVVLDKAMTDAAKAAEFHEDAKDYLNDRREHEESDDAVNGFAIGAALGVVVSGLGYRSHKRSQNRA